MYTKVPFKGIGPFQVTGFAYEPVYTDQSPDYFGVDIGKGAQVPK